MSTRKTLEERVKDRPLGVWPFHDIVRAELNRLARQVRKNKKNLYSNHAESIASRDPRDLLLSERCQGGIDALDEVLRYIDEVKK
jgi:hypothetical protein